MAKYGAPPVDMGLVDLSPSEMMCWLYLPITLPGLWVCQLPKTLQDFHPIVDRVRDEIGETMWDESYVYITAKTLFVTPENPGNRPGWHSDGFLTDDLNFIWSDSEPTVFFVSDELVDLPADHSSSMVEMERLARTSGRTMTFPDKHLLRLDQSVIHKVADRKTSGMRTFVKVSVSKHLYAQIGNSINHALDYPRPKFPRAKERNCPASTSNPQMSTKGDR